MTYPYNLVVRIQRIYLSMLNPGIEHDVNPEIPGLEKCSGIAIPIPVTSSHSDIIE